MKKILIAVAIIAASFMSVSTSEAATQEVVSAQYHTELGTFEALDGAKRAALLKVAHKSQKYCRIIKYLELSYPDRCTCKITCIIEYE